MSSTKLTGLVSQPLFYFFKAKAREFAQLVMGEGVGAAGRGALIYKLGADPEVLCQFLHAD